MVWGERGGMKGYGYRCIQEEEKEKKKREGNLLNF